MLQQLINHSPDIKNLSDEGYQLEISGGHLLVHHVPYLNSSLVVKHGTIVCVLTLVSTIRTGRPQDHTIYFIGEMPCNADGSPLNAIINNSNTVQLSEKLTVNHYFSSKPASGNYNDFYDKVRTYAEILGSQARVIDRKATCRPNRKKAA